MTKMETLQLKLTATRVRMGVIEATHGAGSGHPGGSLSCADVLTYLYFREMRVDPEQPQSPDRDRFVLSKGHCAPALYSVLAERGFFPVADLPTLRHSNSYLQGHPNMNTVPGVDMSTGSLGQGGQTYLEGSNQKIAGLRSLLDRVGSRAMIQIDGGVTPQNLPEAYVAGARSVVAGSAVFGGTVQSGVAYLRRSCAF